MTHPTLYDPQRERILAALEARQAEEEAPPRVDYLALLPEAPEPPRRITFREWLGLTFNRYTIYEALHGEPAPAIGCYCRDCIDRAAERHLRFWCWIIGLAIGVIYLIGVWRWTS